MRWFFVSAVVFSACSGPHAVVPDGGDFGADAGLTAGGGGAAAGGTAGGSSAGGSAGGGSAGGSVFCAPRPTGAEVNSLTVTTTPTDYGMQGALAVQVRSDVANPRWPQEPITVYRPADALQYPVIFYSHAFLGSDHTRIAPMLRRLASAGFNVVFVPYKGLSVTRTEQYATLWEGFRAAATQYGALFDLTRVGFMGHSFGGGATPELARRAFAAPTLNGLTQPWGSSGRFLFIMAPWFSFPALESPTATNDDFRDLPLDVKVVVQVFADDDTNDHLIARQDVWDKLPTGLERSWQVISSDQCGADLLLASHNIPPGDVANAGDNALDVWGITRHALALADYAVGSKRDAAKEVAFGLTEAGRSMGQWVGCGGRQVVPLTASTSPVFTPCSGGAAQPKQYTFDVSQHCRYSDRGAAGTPPCR
ncbi:MAG: hypothetical protein JNM69_04620 [Archangium sp.]|nr:hypothetical protein [Archangium sp.]